MFPAFKTPRLALVLPLLLSLLLPCLANAELNGEFEMLAGSGWQAQGVSFGLGLTPTPAVSIDIQQLRFTGFDLPLNNLHFSCLQLGSGPGRLRCRSSQLNVELGALPKQEVVELALAFDFDWGQSELLAWSVSIEEASFSAAVLQQTLPAQLLPTQVSEFTLTDSLVDFKMSATGRGSELEKVSTRLVLEQFGFSNQWGTQAAEGLSGIIEFSVELDSSRQPHQERYHFASQVVLSAGDIFINPLFLTLAADSPSTDSPVTVTFKASGYWQPAVEMLSLNMSYQHGDLLDVGGTVKVGFSNTKPELFSGFGRLRMPQLTAAYPVYLQPFVSETLLDDLIASGGITARLSYHHQRGITSLGLGLDQLTLIDQQQRFSIDGLSATLPYRGADQSTAGKLAWNSIQLYRLPLGAGSSSIHFDQVSPADSMAQSGSRLRLEVSPVAFLDGSIKAGQVSVSGLGSDVLQVTLGGEIEPVSLAKLSVALGWPEMAGSLSGVLPAAHYQEGRVTLDGKLALNIFDGEIELANLEVENLFGLVPRFSANLKVDKLDLGLLTKTFEFGAITGRSSGYINQLQMESWQPVAFDSWFQTPPGDPGSHKISQRALNSLSSVGGISGALQSTLLRFFDDFSYRRLGIGCKLSNGTCQMRGIADHRDGYYIVQGGGLWPQINLVGYNRQVNWPVLLQRLSAAASADEFELR